MPHYRFKRTKIEYTSTMAIVGKCMEMCPRKELQMREREGLLHKFECARSVSNNSAVRGNSGRQYGRRQLPEADVHKVVKSFARSAAGLNMTVPEDLRPPSVLLRTVRYLCHEVLPRQEEFNLIYDFIFDRLRSVRQDLVIQRITDKPAITILETIIRFHVYSAYRLSGQPIDKFDPQINYKHLADCLKKLMFLYELNNYRESSRKEFETLHLIVTFESKTSDTINRALSLRSETKDPILDAALDVCFSYDCLNFVRIFRLMERFPPLTRAYFTQYATSIRSSALERMTIAYGVKTSKVPLKAIARSLRYPSVELAARDLYLVGAEIFEDETSKEKFARFTKANSPLCKGKAKELCDKLGGLGLEKLDENADFVAKTLICLPSS